MGVPISRVEYKKWLCHMSLSIHYVHVPVEYKKYPCRMSLWVPMLPVDF